MLALAAIAMVLGVTFATTARLTISCTRVKVKSADDGAVSCYVEQAGAWTRSSRTMLFRNPQHVKVEQRGSMQHVTVDGQLLLDSDLDAGTLEHLAKETALLQVYGDHVLGHAGGWVVDLRVVLCSFAVAVVLFALSARRHRVVVDRDEEEIRATSSIAFVPWTTHRTSFRVGDRVVARLEAGRARLVLVGARGPITLIEDDARGGGIERLALRVDAALPRTVEG
ncbi:MAG: hypothetical protein ACXVCJ_29440 [Polyangiales bacterium]